ncbi:MAG: pseudouridylate synthase [Betaproteobacteria bacterium]|nr:pseudouridylate synthase [Betaproteobacteria bacterium]
MSTIILLNKPFGVLCQFSPEAGRRTLKDFVPEPDVYPAGRLDADSEGLVVLTADGVLQNRIADPRRKQLKTYFVQVEGTPAHDTLNPLRSGIALDGTQTLPAKVEQVEEPSWLWARTPPIRVRRLIPTAWLKIEITEGKNRQVRRMTAAVGLPTLRLIRYSVGEWTIDALEPGAWRELEVATPKRSSAPRRGPEGIGDRRQPFRPRGVKGRALPHTSKRNK